MNACTDELVQNAYQRLMPTDPSKMVPRQIFCTYLNVSVCNATTQNNQFVVTIYNPHAQKRLHYVRLPFAADSAPTVLDSQGRAPLLTLVPVDASTKRLWKYMTDGHIPVQQVNNILLVETVLPPLGWSSYYVTASSSKIHQREIEKDEAALPVIGTFAQIKDKITDFIMENDDVAVHFDTQSGLMTSVTNKQSRVTLNITPTLKYYLAMDTRGVNQPSGAYIFRPLNNTPVDFGKPTVEYVRDQGGLVQEVRQTFSSWAFLTTKLYRVAPFVELEWTVGPIPIE
jgi:lysosomal alpha-mannosidase